MQNRTNFKSVRLLLGKTPFAKNSVRKFSLVESADNQTSIRIRSSSSACPLVWNHSVAMSNRMSRSKVVPAKLASAVCSKVTQKTAALRRDRGNRCPQIPKGRMFWTARLAGKVLPCEARCSVCEGLSPNTLRYSTEKRPNSPKPKQVAISVTVTSSASAHKSARLARDRRNIRRRRHGARPQALWKALRSVRSLTSRVRHKVEMCSGSSMCARANLTACSTRSLHGLPR